MIKAESDLACLSVAGVHKRLVWVLGEMEHRRQVHTFAYRELRRWAQELEAIVVKR